jgi:hypothetical protein
MAEVLEPKDHDKSALDEFSVIFVTLPVPPFLHGLSGRIMLNFARHTNLCIHNSESYMFLELSLFSYFLALVCQLIVRSMCAFVHRCLLLLWPVKSFYSGMTRRNKTPVPHPYLELGQSNCIPRIKLPIQLLILFYPEVLPTLCQECHENCTFLYEFLI